MTQIDMESIMARYAGKEWEIQSLEMSKNEVLLKRYDVALGIKQHYTEYEIADISDVEFYVTNRKD